MYPVRRDTAAPSNGYRCGESFGLAGVCIMLVGIATYAISKSGSNPNSA